MTNLNRVLAERNSWKIKYEEYEKNYELANEKWNAAKEAAYKPAKDLIEKELCKFESLTFKIRINRTFDEGFEAYIKCNDIRDDEVALVWEFTAMRCTDGSVIMKTNSYSGLNAVTQKQIISLHEIADALEILNLLDWKNILDIKLPDRDQFFNYERVDRINYVNLIEDAAIKDTIGKNRLLYARIDSSYDNRSAYVQVVGETNKFWKLKIYYFYDPCERYGVKKTVDNARTIRVKKDCMYLLNENRRRIKDETEIVMLAYYNKAYLMKPVA